MRGSEQKLGEARGVTAASRATAPEWVITAGTARGESAATRVEAMTGASVTRGASAAGERT